MNVARDNLAHLVNCVVDYGHLIIDIRLHILEADQLLLGAGDDLFRKLAAISDHLLILSQTILNHGHAETLLGLFALLLRLVTHFYLF